MTAGARRAVVLLAAALLAAACSSGTLVRLAYSNAATVYANAGAMIAWTVDDYVELEPAQEAWVHERAARALEWHRTQELPKLRALLESMLAHADRPFDADVVAEHHRQVRARIASAIDALVPDIAAFFEGLEPLQVVQLERKFAADNRAFVRESLRGTPEERRARRAQRFIGHLEGWVGKLDEAQRAMVEAHYRTLPDLSDELLGERRYRQSRILQLLRERPPREALAAEIRRLFVEIDSWRRPEYAEKLRLRDRRGAELLAALSATLSAEQRGALRKRIRGFLDDITEVMAARD